MNNDGSLFFIFSVFIFFKFNLKFLFLRVKNGNNLCTGHNDEDFETE